MVIGIMADTHGHLERVRRAVAMLRNEGARALFHCGDLTDLDVALALGGGQAFVVRGNNDPQDGELGPPLERAGITYLGEGGEVVVGGKRIAITHGHSLPTVRRLLAAGPHYLFLGHSHRQTDRREGATRVINPGALHRATPWTVALLDLGHDDLRYLIVNDSQ